MMRSGSMLLVMAAVAVLGCGKKSTAAGAPDAGQVGSGGSGGSAVASAGHSAAGSSGTGASGNGAGGSAGRAAVAPVMCGTAMCKASTIFLTACCLDEKAGTCGVKNGTMCALPGVPDPRCPNRPAAMGLTAKGCCTADNKCGGTLMGLPCIVPATDGGAPPLACDAAGADAGS